LIVSESELIRILAGKKSLVFRISASFLMTNREDALEKISDAVRQIKATSKDIVCVFSPHENVAQIENLDLEFWGKYGDLMGLLKKDEDIIYDDQDLVRSHIDDCTAYYGSPCYLAHVFGLHGKPVMIMDVNCRSNG